MDEEGRLIVCFQHHWPEYIRCAEDVCGEIPYMLHDDDPRPAREQFQERYAHGGGWRPMKGHKMGEDMEIKYPGDPVMWPWALMKLRDETVVVYQYGWVAIIQPDGSYEVARMD